MAVKNRTRPARKAPSTSAMREVFSSTAYGPISRNTPQIRHGLFRKIRWFRNAPRVRRYPPGPLRPKRRPPKRAANRAAAAPSRLPTTPWVSSPVTWDPATWSLDRRAQLRGQRPQAAPPSSRLPVPRRMPDLMAGRIERRQFPAAHEHQRGGQPTMPADPSFDRGRIELHDDAATLLGRHQRAGGIVVIRGRMEAQRRAAGDADPIPWNNAGQQSASRQARPIDDDAVARGAHLLELLHIGGNFTPRVVNDTNIGKSGTGKHGAYQHDKRQQRRRQCAGRNGLPLHKGPSPDRRFELSPCFVARLRTFPVLAQKRSPIQKRTSMPPAPDKDVIRNRPSRNSHKVHPHR